MEGVYSVRFRATVLPHVGVSSTMDIDKHYFTNKPVSNRVAFERGMLDLTWSQQGSCEKELAHRGHHHRFGLLSRGLKCAKVTSALQGVFQLFRSICGVPPWNDSIRVVCLIQTGVVCWYVVHNDCVRKDTHII